MGGVKKGKWCPECTYQMIDKMTMWVCTHCGYSESKPMQSSRDNELAEKLQLTDLDTGFRQKVMS